MVESRTATIALTAILIVSVVAPIAVAQSVESTYPTNDPTGVAVGQDRFFVSSFDGSTQRVSGYYKNGTQSWQNDFSASGPILYNRQTGEVVSHGYDGSEYTIQWFDPASGQLLQEYNSGNPGDMIQSDDGTVYTNTINNIKAYNPDRSLKWSNSVSIGSMIGADLSPDGNFLYWVGYETGTSNDYIYRVDPETGDFTRNSLSTDDRPSGVMVDSDGNIYVSYQDGDIQQVDSSGTVIEEVSVTDGFGSGGHRNQYSSETDRMYLTGDQAELHIIDTSLSQVDTIQTQDFVRSVSVDQNYSPNVKVYYAVENTGISVYDTGQLVNPSTLSGTVTDGNSNDPIQQATVNVTNATGSQVAQTTTNDVGKYSVDLINGSYTVTVSKQDYSKESQDVTISGSDETVDFALTEFNQSIELRTKQYLEHGQESRYSVIVSVDGNRQNVTSEATVVSGNTSVVTVDSGRFYIVATSNIQVNQRTTLTATWTDSDGNTYTTERNVTVANATVANIDILPTWTSVSASLSDQTLQVILLATMVGAGAAALASSFAGLSASTGIVVLGWFAGYTSDGILIVSFMFAMFVGLNLSQNTTIMNRSG